MISIAELCAKHGTDKGYFHRYGEVYDMLLARHRTTAKQVLEIGVQTGASLCVWAEAFPQAHVVGFDIDISQVDRRLPENITLFQGDAYEGEPDTVVPYDIIIDDGPHTVQSQILAAQIYLPLLARHGTFVIEDVLSQNTAAMIATVLEPRHLDHAFVIDRSIAPPLKGTGDAGRASRLFVVDMVR